MKISRLVAIISAEVLLCFAVTFDAYSQTITGCRTPDELWIYYTPANPSNDGNIYNRTFFYSPNDRYATNYTGANTPCTVRNPIYYPGSSGMSGDFGVCKIKFLSGDVEGRIFTGQLIPCQLPLDNYSFFSILVGGIVCFFIIRNSSVTQGKI